MKTKKIERGRKLKFFAAAGVLLAVLLMPIFLAGCGEKEKRLNFYCIDAVFDDETKTLSCLQKVEYVNSSDNALEQVCFFLYANAFNEGRKAVANSYLDRAYPNGESFGGIYVSSAQVDGLEAEFSVSEGGNILTVNLPGELFPDECVTIEMEYVVALANIRHRLGYGESTINFGNFFPIACVYEDGFVKNEFCANGDPFYSDVANFEVKITYPDKYVLASTGTQEQDDAQAEKWNLEQSVTFCHSERSEESRQSKDLKEEKSLTSGDPSTYSLCSLLGMTSGGTEANAPSRTATAGEDGNMVTTICKAEKVRDFCFVLSEKFSVLSEKVGGVTVKYFHYDDPHADEHLQTSVKALETFCELFGQYPYAELSVVKADFCFGGMEYPNLVLIADDLSADDVDYVIVHEIAHQWWYGLVGNNEFENAWVDEGLTEFSTALFFEDREEYGLEYEKIMDGARDVYKTFARTFRGVYEGTGVQFDESMNRTLTEFATEPEYVNLTYTKGMLMFDSIRKTMSDRRFFKCLQNYFEEYEFQNSSAEKLAESFSKTAHINMEKFIEAWTNGRVAIG